MYGCQERDRQKNASNKYSVDSAVNAAGIEEKATQGPCITQMIPKFKGLWLSTFLLLYTNIHAHKQKTSFNLQLTWGTRARTQWHVIRPRHGNYLHLIIWGTRHPVSGILAQNKLYHVSVVSGRQLQVGVCCKLLPAKSLLRGLKRWKSLGLRHTVLN